MQLQLCQEVKFHRGARSLAGKRWHQGGEPTLALHGWLDNANSFNYLAPHLPELDIVALDFAGHGLSDHRAADIAYRVDLDLEDILWVADQLEWQQFNVIGHSMGAEYGSQLAGLFPEKVRTLVCIDGFVDTADCEKMLEMRAKRIQANLASRTTRMRIFPSIEDMAQRVVAATAQSYASAFELVERGHKKVQGGYSWITDSRLKQDAWEVLAGEEIAVLVKKTLAPTLLIDARDGQHWFRPSLEIIEDIHPSLKIVTIDGAHHLHMEEPSGSMVAKEIRHFMGLVD